MSLSEIDIYQRHNDRLACREALHAFAAKRTAAAEESGEAA